MTVALYRSGRAGIRRLHQLFFPALVLAFVVIGYLATGNPPAIDGETCKPSSCEVIGRS
jgi:hypothetical protein